MLLPRLRRNIYKRVLRVLHDMRVKWLGLHWLRLGVIWASVFLVIGVGVLMIGARCHDTMACIIYYLPFLPTAPALPILAGWFGRDGHKVELFMLLTFIVEGFVFGTLIALVRNPRSKTAPGHRDSGQPR